MAIAAHTLLLCGVPATAAARQNPRTALCNAHFQKHQQACAQHINALTLLAQHEMTAHLSRETSDPKLLAWHRPGLNLLHDLGQLLGLYAHTDLHHVHHLPKQDDITPWAIQHHERHAAHWQQRIAHLMHGFEQFLRTNWLLKTNQHDRNARMNPIPKTPQIPHSHAQRWLLAYDIRDPKRLQRVGRYLRQEGVRLQYSVYLLSGNREHIEHVVEQLRQLINEKADDVRIYPLTENTRIWGLGTQFDDGGNTLSDAFMDKLIQSETSNPTAEQGCKKLSY
jgi:CRISPR-associated protein Cas2